MSAQTDSDAIRQRAAAALLAFLTSPEHPHRWRILEPSDLPTLERLSIAARIPLTLHRLNLTSLTETLRPLGWSASPPSAPD